MKALEFDSRMLPARDRLPAFRAGAVDFRVDADGDPLHFAISWRLLKLGDLNAIHSRATPVHYRRDQAMIEADGEDRVAIHYYARGGAVGTIDGHPAEVGPGGAMVWDLTRPVDIRAFGDIEMLIVTLPRYMLDEVILVPSYSGVLAPGPELALAVNQLRYMFDHAADLPEEGAPYFGRAVRDLFVVAMLPMLRCSDDVADPTAGPLFRRICDLLDANADRDFDEEELAAALDEPVAAVRQTTDHFGGLALLVERRRLLAAYRLLCDPDEAAPVSSIARRCGFNDLSRFSRRFRNVFHTSPRDLRLFRYGHLPKWAGAYHVDRNYSAMIAH